MVLEMIFVKRDSPKCAIHIKKVGVVRFKYLVRFKSREVEDYLSGSEGWGYRMAMKILGQPLLAHVGDLRGKKSPRTRSGYTSIQCWTTV